MEERYVSTEGTFDHDAMVLHELTVVHKRALINLIEATEKFTGKTGTGYAIDFLSDLFHKHADPVIEKRALAKNLLILKAISPETDITEGLLLTKIKHVFGDEIKTVQDLKDHMFHMTQEFGLIWVENTSGPGTYKFSSQLKVILDTLQTKELLDDLK